MAFLAHRRQPWWPLYRAERDAQILTRVRLVAGLILPAVLVLTLYQIVRDPSSSGARTWLAVAFVAELLVSWIATWIPASRRNAPVLAVVFVLGLVAVAATTWRLTPQDIALAPLNAIAITMGMTVLFPWGMTPQAIVSCAVTAGYAWAAGAAPVPPPGYPLGLMVALVPLMAIGARLIEDARRASFERTWQKEQLVALARDLAAQVDPTAAVHHVLEHARHLVGADWTSALLWDPERRVFHLTAIVGAGVEQSWVGTDFAAEDVAVVVQRGFLILPEEDPRNYASALLAQDGVRHAAHVVMRHGTEVVGILNFARRHETPFGAGDQAVMRGIADQAGVALRTARLMHDLRQANELKSEFVSTMSHELRTPLNVILGFAEMAQDEALGPPQRAECLQRIETAGRELLDLIEGTLEIGRLEANQNRPRLEPVDLPTFWAEQHAICARLPRKPAVALDWAGPVPALTVETDPRKLSVILRNLVGNACKFTERGHVRVRILVDGPRLGIEVSDTGIGIRPEDHATVFQMFRQADGSDSRKFGGTGLGLYIVQRFAEQLGGRVDLASTLGNGATFTVWITPAMRSLAARAA